MNYFCLYCRDYTARAIPLTRNSKPLFCVSCGKCGADGPADASKEIAIAAWVAPLALIKRAATLADWAFNPSVHYMACWLVLNQEKECDCRTAIKKLLTPLDRSFINNFKELKGHD